MKLTINIETIPHNQHRYPTVGDWFYDDQGVLQIRVSEMATEAHAMVVVLHEVIESVLCKFNEVTQADADAFDKQFEDERFNGDHDLFDEPGDDPDAPYHREHVTASICERAIAQALFVDWNKYIQEIDNLDGETLDADQ